MKNFLLLLLFFAAKSITSQNGWTTYTTSATSGTFATAENVLFIDNAGNKWIGFNGSFSTILVGRYNSSTNNWTFWNKAAMGISTSSVANVLAFEEDNSGNIWIGTGNGLIKYDGASFNVYTMAHGLPNNYIRCLEFNNNMLYIGTQNGLSRYDGITFTNYTSTNSLFPATTVWDIKAENANTIWAACGNKLVKFYINSTFTSTSYTASVPSSTFTTLNRIYIDASGIKWCIGNSGIIKYDNVNFTYFETLCPNYTGTAGFDAADIGKGPNNGVMVTGADVSYGGYRILIELMPTGKVNFFYPPASSFLGGFSGTSFEYDVSGNLYMTGAITGPTNAKICKIYSLNPSAYSPALSFGLGCGITPDNYQYLDINRVKAGIMNRGDMWWDIGSSGNSDYEVPKGSFVPSGFAAALWMGGLDASNQLHTSAQTYRQSGNDFWPGPLDTTNASIDTATAYNYDKIWKVDYNDINTFVTQFGLGNVPFTYTPTPDILSWPAKGTGNKSRNLAPFVDVNGNGIYDPLVGGDYPKIKGDQTLYFIFNDNFAAHGETSGLSLGVEVHAMAYAYGCPATLNGRNELAYTTFYDYKIYNRSSNNYHDMYIGFWTDVDLGCYVDDYIGCSPQNNVGFCYNSDGQDENCGSNGYNYFPPAVGTTVLKGPYAAPGDGMDNDNDSIVDEVGEQHLMNVFDYFNNTIASFPVATQGPTSKYHYYTFLKGQHKDSTDFTCGGNAYGGTIKTPYVYPWTDYLGNPCGPGTWSESTAGNLPSDRRYLLSSGPFDFPAFSSTEIEYAQVWSVDSSATSNVNIASANKLISDTRKIRAFYNAGGSNCLSSINIGIKENELNNSFNIYPNPASSVLHVKSEVAMGKTQIKIYDVLGKTVLESKIPDLYQTSIHIEELNSGIYFINLKFDNNKSVVKKFVKQ